MDHINIKAVRRRLAKELLKEEREKALATASILLSYYKRNPQGNNALYADDLFNAALAFENSGIYEQASTLYTDSSRILLTLEGEGINFLRRIVNLSALCGKTGNYDSGVKLMESAVLLFKKTGIPDKGLLSLCYYNLGNLMVDNGDVCDGITYLKRALRLCPDKHGSDYADILLCIGIGMEASGDFDGAISYTKRVKRLLAGDPAECARVTSYLADIYENQGELKKSALALTELSAMLCALNGRRSRAAFTARRRLAEVMAKDGRFKEAIAERITIIRDLKAHSFEPTLTYANELREVALLCRELGRNKWAVRFIKKAIEVKKRLLAPSCHDYLIDLILLISIYIDTMEYKQAMELMGEITLVTEKAERL